MSEPAPGWSAAEHLAEQAVVLQEQVRVRTLEIEAQQLQVRHLQADLGVKDGYIAMLEQHTEMQPDQLRSAERDAAPVRLVRRMLLRAPRALRLVHPLTRRLGDRIAPGTRRVAAGEHLVGDDPWE